MTIYYYDETLDNNQRDYCGNVADIKDDVLSRLYALTENNSYCPVWTCHDKDEIPEIDDESDDYDVAEKDAIDAYLQDGGTFPFYVVRTPGETPDESFSCCTDGHGEPDWEALLNEWQCFLDGSNHQYVTTYFFDPAEFILDALKDGSVYKASIVAGEIFDVTPPIAEGFCKLVKAIKKDGLHTYLVEHGDGDIDNAYYISTLSDEDEKYLDDGYSIDEVENQVKAAFRDIDEYYKIELTKRLF